MPAHYLLTGLIISRRGSARVRRGHPILLPEVLCLLPSQRLPRPLRTPLIISRRGSDDSLLRSFRGVLFIPPIISRPNADLRPPTTPLAPAYYPFTIPLLTFLLPPNISRLTACFNACLLPYLFFCLLPCLLPCLPSAPSIFYLSIFY